MGVQRIEGLIAVVLTLFVAQAASAQAPPANPWTHTHPLSSSAIELLADATERSSIVASLLDELEQTDVVVYIVDSMPGVISGPTSYLAFLSLDATARYLLIRIDRFRLSPPERIVSLGHELQHALEVAAAPDVKGGGCREVGHGSRTPKRSSRKYVAHASRCPGLMNCLCLPHARPQAGGARQSEVSEQRRKDDHDDRRPRDVDRQVTRLPAFEIRER